MFERLNYFSKLLLSKSESFEDFGTPQLYSALSLFVAWIIVGVCIIRGVKSSGKVAYFTAIFPYIVILILIIQSATLSGAGEGVKYYVIPKWDLVGKFEVISFDRENMSSFADLLDLASCSIASLFLSWS